MRLSLKNNAPRGRSASATSVLREFLRARGLRMTEEREALLEAALAPIPEPSHGGG